MPWIKSWFGAASACTPSISSFRRIAGSMTNTSPLPPSRRCRATRRLGRLADAGAKVTISYRGKGFNRAAPKNKSAIERYAAEGRVKAKLGSQVLQFDGESVTLALADGQQKRYPNDAAFVLIGAVPPVQWLEKMGIKFVERPH